MHDNEAAIYTIATTMMGDVQSVMEAVDCVEAVINDMTHRPKSMSDELRAAVVRLVDWRGDPPTARQMALVADAASAKL